MNKSIATAVVAGCHDFTTRVRRRLKAIAQHLGVNASGELSIYNSVPPIELSVTYGPELSPNVSFDTDANGWSLGGGWSYDAGSGALLWTVGVTANPYTGVENLSLEPGEDYLIEVDARIATESPFGWLNVYFAPTALQSVPVGHSVTTLQAGAAVNRFGFVLTARENDAALVLASVNTPYGIATTVERVSIRKINNNAATMNWVTGNVNHAVRLSKAGLGISEGALAAVGLGGENIALGTSALGALDTAGIGNVGIGAFALAGLRSGSGNFAMGARALKQMHTGSDNVALGNAALGFVFTATGTTAIGTGAGGILGNFNPITSTLNSVFIGKDTKANGQGQTNQIVVGYNAVGNGSNTAVWGNTSIVSHTFHGGMVINEGGGAFGLRVEADTDINLLFTDGTGTGRVGIGTNAPTARLDLASDILRVRTAKTPASATAAGNAGDHCWDANYLYVCVATNTWKRTPLVTW